MFINFMNLSGEVLPIPEISKIVIYGSGKKLFERESSELPMFETFVNSYGNEQIREAFHSSPEGIHLAQPVKSARKENLMRKDNYTLSYVPSWAYSWDKRIALYIHESEISVDDLGDLLAFETDEEKNYLHGVRLCFHHPIICRTYHVEFIQTDDSWTLPEGSRWSEAYGSKEHPCFDTYDYSKSHLERARKKGKGVVKRWSELETLEDANYVCAERYYVRCEESPERLRRRALADRLNSSPEYAHQKDKWSHYDIEKLEKALGYKLTIAE